MHRKVYNRLLLIAVCASVKIRFVYTRESLIVFFVSYVFRFVFIRREQSRKDAFDSRKRELKALGLGQDGRPIKKVDEGKEKKSRGKVRRGDFSSNKHL